jgi:hypothetical protein
MYSAYLRRLIGIVLLPMLALAPLKNAGIVQEHDLPGDMDAGETRVVTWSLDIYDCEGFARFQVQFPEGIEATALETAQASFSFEGGKAKFIWMELPPKNTLDVSLEVTANSDFQGGSVTQWFSFIRDGRRKDVEFEPHHMTRSVSSAFEQQDSAQDIEVQRLWTATTNRTGTMSVTIRGHEPGQFLKLSETLGTYGAISVLDDADCDIRDAFEDQLVFIWQAAPSARELVVKYTLRDGRPDQVTGRISTIQNNAAIEQTVEALQPPALTAPTAPSSTPPSTPPVEPAPTEPAPTAEDVAFRIQILATHAAVSSEAVKRIYAYPGEVRHEQHEAWHKYTTGYHTTYRAARDNRVDLNSNHAFPGPFVTAYRNGQRITVQEALLVTKQNWIP